eukprot:12427631-Karenia_brevis.AAC.1
MRHSQVPVRMMILLTCFEEVDFLTPHTRAFFLFHGGIRGGRSRGQQVATIFGLQPRARDW